MHIFLFTTVPEFEWWLSVDCEFRVRDLVVTGYGLGAAEGDPVAPGGGRLRDALEASVVMRVGAPAGITGAAPWGVDAEASVVATWEDVARAVAAVMGSGEEGSVRRARAAELGRKLARRAAAHRTGTLTSRVSCNTYWSRGRRPNHRTTNQSQIVRC